MSWVAVAIGGSAIINGVLQSNAASRASDAQAGAANQANQISQAQYNQTRQDQLPWMQRGNAAGNQLAYLLGLPGYGPMSNPVAGAAAGMQYPQGGNPAALGAAGMQFTQKGPNDLYPVNEGENRMMRRGFDDGTGGNPGEYGDPGNGAVNSLGGFSYNPGMGGYGSLSKKFGMEDFQTDPGYQFRLSEGAKALERSAAARGMSLSGAQQKALIRYNQDFSSNEYINAYNRYNNDQTSLYNKLAGVSGTGQQTATQLGSQGMNLANYMGGNLMGAANAYGASQMAGANALGGTLNNLANSWMQYNMWKR